MRVIICDDEPVMREQLTRYIEMFAQTHDRLIDVAAFSSAEAFLFAYDEDPRADVLLLDVEMGQMNGVSLAQELRARHVTAPIIFVTGFPDYMAQGYDVAALHYLLKPVREDKLFEVLGKAFAAAAASPRALLLPDGKDTVRMYENEIRFVEAQGHYVVIHTVAKTTRLRLTLAAFLKHSGAAFCQCSRSYAVGLRYVHRVTKTAVILDDGSELPLGKGFYEAVNLALLAYVRSM